MEFFKNLKSYLRWFGILPWSFNSKATIFTSAWNCILLGIYISYFLAPLAHILSKNLTFNELTETSFYVLSSLLTILWYSVCIWQKRKYVALFIDLDHLMERSKKKKNSVKISICTYYGIFL